MTEPINHPFETGHAETIRIGAKIRSRRKELKLTLEEVASASSLSPGFLSLVERDLSYPSLTTLSKIASALKVSMEVFLAFPKGDSNVSYAQSRPMFEVNEGGVLFARISANFKDAVLNSVEITLPPHYSSTVSSHTGEELVYVLSGQLLHVLDDKKAQLGSGDAVHLQSTLPHCWINETDLPVRLLWVGDLPIFDSGSD